MLSELMDFNISLSDQEVFAVAKITSVFFMATFIFGIFGNGMIILATFRSKQLHNPCNILIACQALSDLLLGVGHPPYAFFAFSETRISFSKCFFVQVLSFSAMNTSTILIFFVGVDRVLSVKFVTFYKRLNSWLYVSFVLIASMVYCNALNILAFFTRTEEMTVCLVPEAYTGLGKNVAFGSHLVINILVLVIYRYLGRITKRTQGSSAGEKMVKSLRTVVICTVFGWFITFLLCNTAMALTYK
ncbi:hypothetical protein L596_016053 [Steinernema carpocapsae]|uniref:G-protein coupled receptors family 1 profile domain-containing protein n=1 Tax=Steinernema carpocapsae TaxID=34508 RepID=A0A4U5NI23_STECR|nr:hypothetical protein L596_016053 [Steinernema carpocapsae]